jgi:O-antigen/teichoic acid export membrane protein
MATISISEITPHRLKTWGARSVFSLSDQALISGSSFALNVILARWLTKEAYGAFALSFSAFLFLSGFHNVLLIEPMTVIGPSSYPQRFTEYFSAQLRLHIVLTSILSGTILLCGGALIASKFQHSLARIVLAAGISLPFLLLLLLVRRMCYTIQNPLLALRGSATYFALLLGGACGLHQIGWLNGATAFLWMACVSLLTSLFILNWVGLSYESISQRASIRARPLLKENWGYGRWLTLTTVLSWVTMQIQAFLAAGFLGLGAAGILRAMQLPSLAMTQFTAAMLLIVLPSLSMDMGNGNLSLLRKKAAIAAGLLTTLAILFVLFLYLSSGLLERWMFGGKYAAFAWLMPVLGLVPVFAALSGSFSLALRVFRKSHLELLAYILSSAAALGLSFALIPRWGLKGAATSAVCSVGVLSIAVLISYLKQGTLDA